MADMLVTGRSWLAGQMIANASRTMRYIRGVQSVQLPMVRSEVTIEVTGELGFPIRTQATDFLCEMARLVLDGVPLEPERGDRIEDCTADRTETFEVTLYGDQGHVEPEGAMWRIHTRLVKSE